MDYIQRTVNGIFKADDPFKDIVEGDESIEDRVRAVGDKVADAMNHNKADQELFNRAREALETLTEEGEFERMEREMLTHHLEDIIEQDMSNNGAIHYAQEGYQEAVDEYIAGDLGESDDSEESEESN
jgi:hypothetical protein